MVIRGATATMVGRTVDGVDGVMSMLAVTVDGVMRSSVADISMLAGMVAEEMVADMLSLTQDMVNRIIAADPRGRRISRAGTIV